MNHLCKLLLISFAIFFLKNIGTAQSLPINMHYYESEHRLTLSALESTGFYDESIIESVYIDFYDADYWDQMGENYDTEEYVLADITIGDEVFESVAVGFKGNTSYTKAVEQGSEKLSLSVQLDEVLEDQEIEEYSNLNFNNAFGDASFMIEVLYSKLARKHIPAPRANFIHLYLDGEDWGIYPNIQQVNKDFLKEWFMNNDGIRWRAIQESNEGGGGGPGGGGPGGGGTQWGDGKSALNFYGTDTTEYQPNYELKSSDIDNPWDYLVETCNALNNIPIDELYDSIGSYINLDATLWYLATEILFSDDDSYIYKGEMDYCLYYDEETKLMYPLEFDGNSAMNTKNQSWDLFYNEDNENFPLLNRLLQVPEIRQRYIAHVKTILDDSFDETVTDEIIDNIAALIEDQVTLDPKNDNTYYEYTTAVSNLKSFVANRKSFILSNTEMAEESPAIDNVLLTVDGVEWAVPLYDDAIEITAEASHSDGISTVYLYYGTQFFGDFQKVEMISDGQNYSYTLEGFNPGDYVRFYIEAVANNDAETRSYEPVGAEHDVYVFRVNVEEFADSELVINEFMASNSNTYVDEYDEYDDWIELYNTSDDDISLDGYFLSDDSGELNMWEFPTGTIIEANSFLIIWADSDEDQEGLHANFKLSASGEELFLTNNYSQIIDQVLFTSQIEDISYGRIPNGTGPFQEMEPTPLSSNTIVASYQANENINNELLIYPNPAKQHITVLNNGVSPEHVEIYDVAGKRVFMTTNTSEIDISQLKAGFYVVKADNLSSVFVK